jgi:hypothetical protein
MWPDHSARRRTRAHFLRAVWNRAQSARASYPAGLLGDSLRQFAQLVRADVGLEVAFVETGGWDTLFWRPRSIRDSLPA